MTVTTQYNIDRKKDEVYSFVTSLSKKYLRNAEVSHTFVSEQMDYISAIAYTLAQERTTYNDARVGIAEQLAILNRNEMDIMSNTVKLFAFIQKAISSQNRITLTLKNVGFIGSGLQLTGGKGMCYADLGNACSSFGSATEINNRTTLWQEGHYLTVRRSPKYSPLKTAYKDIASLIGEYEKQRQITYSTIEIPLSSGTPFGREFKPDAWQFFNYIKDDFILSWKKMGASGVTNDTFSSTANGYTVYQIMNENVS
ncbi:DUF4225 domain-containing protein [Enterobacteriaceae bacterium LUAb1]